MYVLFAKERLTQLNDGRLNEVELAKAFTTIDKDYTYAKLAGLYLAGSSERASGNLERLDKALTDWFLTPKPEEVLF